MATIDIGVDFSIDPLGRFRTDGGSSGEAFREDVLSPALKALHEGEKLLVILDNGVESYGSSFLTEGFAGIVKFGYMTAEDLLARLEFKYSNKDFAFYEKKILKYIRDSKFASRSYEPSK